MTRASTLLDDTAPCTDTSAAASAVPLRCVQAEGAYSGAAALTALSAFHGVPLTIDELGELLPGLPLANLDLSMLLVAARALALDALPLEGGFDDLPDVAMPTIVVLRNDGPPRYALVYAVDGEEITLGDPSTGEVRTLGRDAFCARWNGDLIQATPNEAGRAALAGRLSDMRDPRVRLARAIGWAPPYGRRFAFLGGATLALAAGVSLARSNAAAAPLAIAVSVCVIGALWSWLASATCVRCSRAAALAGSLPIAPVGAGYYILILAMLFAGASPWQVASALAVAVGAHGALLLTLARARLRCDACIAVACAALAAFLCTVARGDSAPLAAGAIAAVTFAVTLIGVRISRARDTRRARSVATKLARAVAEESRSADADAVKVVVYKVKGCAQCGFYESVVRPGLEAELGEAVRFEERDLGQAQTVAPLVIVCGAVDTLFIGLPPDPFADVRAVVVDVLQREKAPSRGPLRIVATDG